MKISYKLLAITSFLLIFFIFEYTTQSLQEKYDTNTVNTVFKEPEEKGVTANSKQIRISKEVLLTRVKASIAANIIDNDGFYPIIRRIDKTLQVGIEYSNK